MTTVKLSFRHTDRGNYNLMPFINDPEKTVYKCDGREGEISFSGYYYINNSEIYKNKDDEDDGVYGNYLPQILDMHMILHEKTPYKHIVNRWGYNEPFYKTIEKQSYKIEVYKIIREKEQICHKSDSDDTDNDITEIDKSQEYDCTELNNVTEIADNESDYDICFFPMCIQTIYFRVCPECIITA